MSSDIIDISTNWGSYINSHEIDSSGSVNISIDQNYPIDKFILKDKYFPPTEKVIHNIEFSQFTNDINDTDGSTTFNNFFNNIYGDLFTFDSYLNYTNYNSGLEVHLQIHKHIH